MPSVKPLAPLVRYPQIAIVGPTAVSRPRAVPVSAKSRYRLQNHEIPAQKENSASLEHCLPYRERRNPHAGA